MGALDNFYIDEFGNRQPMTPTSYMPPPAPDGFSQPGGQWMVPNDGINPWQMQGSYGDFTNFQGAGTHQPDPSLDYANSSAPVPGGPSFQADPASAFANYANGQPPTPPNGQQTGQITGTTTPNGVNFGSPTVVPDLMSQGPNAQTADPASVDWSSPTGVPDLMNQQPSANPHQLITEPGVNSLPSAPKPPPAPANPYPGDISGNTGYKFNDATDYSKVGAIGGWDFQKNAYAQANANVLPLELDPNTGLKGGLDPAKLQALVTQYGYQVGQLGYPDYNTAIKDLYAVGAKNPGTDFYLVPQMDGKFGILARARTAQGQMAYGFTPPSMRPPAPPPGGGGGGGNVSRGTSRTGSGGGLPAPAGNGGGGGGGGVDISTAAGRQAVVNKGLNPAQTNINNTPYIVPVNPKDPLNNPTVNTAADYYNVESGAGPSGQAPNQYNVTPGQTITVNGTTYQWNGHQWVVYGRGDSGGQLPRRE